MTGLHPDLVRYLTERDQYHAERVEAALAALTERERRLVREAAVMGFVRGSQFDRHGDDPFPKDPDIVTEVIDSCLTFPDRFPVLSRHTPATGGDDD